MATTTNYSWTTPDDTALVKDGAAAIRTLGSSIDTTTKNLNPSTTLGDIEYRSSTANTNTRLGIGSTGNVLTVAGGVPTWAAPAGGGSNWSLLNAGGTALTGASTITVSGISGKDKIMVLVSTASSDAGATISLRFNADSGANYYGYGYTIFGRSTYSVEITNQAVIGGDTSIPLAIMTSDVSGEISGGLTLTGCNSAGVKQLNSVGGAKQQGGYTNGRSYVLQGYYDSSSTISSVSVVSSSGNFDLGTVYVYTSAS
jgi:hypothetical protein